MVEPAPKIDQRTAQDVALQVQSLLAEYLPQQFRDSGGKPKQLEGISAALVKIFARFSEIIIQRLNQVPEKNFLAFLDLLGASRQPPQPARVPLTFFLAAGSAVDAIVPKGTQVAAPPTAGQEEPVIFETERELLVTAAELVSIFTRDPIQDKYSDRQSLTQLNSTSDLAIFQGEEAIAHVLYIGDDTLLSYPDLQSVTLNFTLLQNLQDSRTLQWQIPGLETVLLSANDTTSNLTRSGSVAFSNLPLIPENTIHQIKSRWLSCQLKTPISKESQLQTGMVRASQLPTINKITIQATLGKTAQGLDYAFTNQLPIDISQSFFAFTEKPKYGDTLYLANQNAFSKSGATVNINFNLANLWDLGINLPNATKEAQPTLVWEAFTTQGWIKVGVSNRNGVTADSPTQYNFQDTTKAFTTSGAVKVSFVLPSQMVATTVNGINNFWLRVRIIGGNYGKDVTYISSTSTAGYSISPATFAPPLITQLTIDYSLTISPKSPQYVLTYNDFFAQKINLGTAFQPFVAISENRPTLYLGFSLPPNRTTFPNNTITLYFRVADVIYQATNNNPPSVSAPRLIWEYWSSKSQAWEKITVRDETEAFTRSGLVELLPPVDFAPRGDFGIERYWLRVRWQSGDYSPVAKLRRILLNTTFAAQTLTIRNQILGSSDGSENQKFNTTQTPILLGQQLQVLEPEIPTIQEQKLLEQVEGKDAISFSLDAAERPQEIWVRWHEVPDFYASKPRDRHYILNHITGEIQFGNGINGLIPPPGSNNIKMAYYQTGGGTKGNQAVGSIIQLKTTVPYVDKVTNIEAASGGAEAESIDSLMERMPRAIRHGGKAVTFEDYEDLAMLATPEVGRVKCVPLVDLRENPLYVQNPGDNTPQAIGKVSLIIVPRSHDIKPIPSQELLNRVQDYLESNAIATATIVVVGPIYVQVNITAEIALVSLEGAAAVEQRVYQALTKFLHPLTGGFTGQGWEFGRQPYNSDFYRLIESVPGVDHIRYLQVQQISELPGAEQTNRFLVYSGQHKITLSFEEP